MIDRGMSRIIKEIERLKKKVRKLSSFESNKIIRLKAPLISVAWDGDARSTEAKTKIDLSSVFGVPAGVRSVLCRIAVRDSGSAGNECWLILSPNNTAGKGFPTRCSGIANNFWADAGTIVPCDSNGDVYYQILASGSLTLDAVIEIWGYEF